MSGIGIRCARGRLRPLQRVTLPFAAGVVARPPPHPPVALEPMRLLPCDAAVRAISHAPLHVDGITPNGERPELAWSHLHIRISLTAWSVAELSLYQPSSQQL